MICGTIWKGSGFGFIQSHTLMPVYGFDYFFGVAKTWSQFFSKFLITYSPYFSSAKVGVFGVFDSLKNLIGL